MPRVDEETSGGPYRGAAAGPEAVRDGSNTGEADDWRRGNSAATVFVNASRYGSGTGWDGGSSRAYGLTGVPCFHSR